MSRRPSSLPPARQVDSALEGFERVPSVEQGFEIEGEVGRGGMGVVHRGRDRRLGRPVAIKVIGQDASAEQALLRRFVTEAQLGAQLEHPNIVPLYSLVATDKQDPAFVMRLVEGETMAAYLESCATSHEASREPPCDLASRLERFLKVCDAVEYAHARGVIHRDLKPENVMLGVHNEVYVMDWGVAHVAGGLAPEPLPKATRALAEQAEREESTASQPPKLTQQGDVFGSAGYMPPEQARAEPVTFASDQYALGMMLAEIVTLSPARSGSTIQQLSEAMLAKPLVLTHRFEEPLPRELVAIIEKATAADSGARYASVELLSADVRSYLRDEEVSVAPDPAWMRLWRMMKRKPALVFGAISLLGFIVSVIVVVALLRELGARDRAAAQSERVSSLTAAVGHTGRTLDARFQRIELLVEGLASGASELVQRPPRAHLDAVAPSDLAPEGSSAQLVDRYRQRVTFERAVHVRSPGVTDSDAAPILARTSEIERLLVHTSARAAADDQVLAFPIEEQRRVARERSPILWTDLAFAEGEVFVYPGNTFFPSSFDARTRPWYMTAATQRAHVWGAPYPDATSGRLLVPCARAFHEEDGKLRGIAAAHVRLDDVLDVLVVPTPGFRWAALVDEAGVIVLSTKERGIQLDAGTSPGGGPTREPFSVAAVREAIVAKRTEGRVFAGAELVVFTRLDTNAWSLAVTVDAAPYEP